MFKSAFGGQEFKISVKNLLRLGLIGFVLHNSPHLIICCNSLYLLRLKHF